MPALPALARQLKQPHDAHQLVGRIGNRDLAGNPVPDGAWRDVKELRRSLRSEPGVRQQDFEAGAKQGAGFTGFAGDVFR